jgi:hypothetical protein
MRITAFIASGALALLCAASRVQAQGSPDDAAIKARVALALARFAEMPGDPPTGPLHLCLAIRIEPPSALLELAQEKGHARSVAVHVGPPFGACDVIYVHASFSEWRKFLAEPRAPALTVGDVPGFLAAGGMIELVIESDSVRFDVNLVALRERRIRLPAQVLKLARQVRQ